MVRAKDKKMEKEWMITNMGRVVSKSTKRINQSVIGRRNTITPTVLADNLKLSMTPNTKSRNK